MHPCRGDRTVAPTFVIIDTMFSPPRSFSIQLILFAAIGLTACTSVFGPANTPTPSAPSPTPVPPTPTPPPLAATVNGEYITQAEYDAELERFRSAQAGQGHPFTDGQAGDIVLEDLVNQVLLSQGARAAGYELTESDLQSRVDALAVQAGGAETLSAWKSEQGYTDEAFRLALKRAAEAAWMRDKIIADVPLVAEQVHIQQILTYNEDTAKNVLDRLNAGTEFNELAVIYDPNTRGELGWVPRGYLLDAGVEQAAFSLEVGAHSQVLTTPAGFHILKLLERDSQHPLSPDALLRMRELALQDWLEQKRAQSGIQPAH
jgi:parvulin-like peptidyl-prolyl isomerase